MLSKFPSWPHPERSLCPPRRRNCTLAVYFWGQFITIPSLNHVSLVQLWWDLHCREVPQPCEQVNQLKGPAGLPSHPQQCSKMQQQMANALMWFRRHLCLGLCFFFPCSACVCRSSRKLLLCQTPLLATVRIPLPRLLRKFANIGASAQEAARALEFPSACWAVQEGYRWMWKHLWSAGSLPCFFWEWL